MKAGRHLIPELLPEMSKKCFIGFVPIRVRETADEKRMRGEHYG
jgi:hypothetical protein